MFFIFVKKKSTWNLIEIKREVFLSYAHVTWVMFHSFEGILAELKISHFRENRHEKVKKLKNLFEIIFWNIIQYEEINT